MKTKSEVWSCEWVAKWSGGGGHERIGVHGMKRTE